MTSQRLVFVLFAMFGCNAAIGRGEEITEALSCVKSQTFLAPMDSSDHRKYAPDREVDLLNLALEVTPDFNYRTIDAKAVLRFKPIAKPLRELQLDAVDLNVRSVTGTEKIQGYQAAGAKLTITFAEAVPPDKEATVTVFYSAEPTRGLYFRTPEMGYKPGDTHLFTQGEAIEARHWYPCFDAPNEKFTSEITCTVPDGMVVLSNGRRLSQERDAGKGLVTVHWKQEKPHVTYLISLVAGYFKSVEDRYRDIPLAFYTPPSQINEAMGSFRDTKEAMAFFEQEIRVPYPWDKYDQVCVNDFVAGGMENTSITTLTDQTLFTEKTENLRSSQGLVAHELAHQWFGDLVTCKDWSHLWLNEGFATYYAHLFTGEKQGRAFMLYDLYHDAKGIIDRTDDTKAIVNRKYDDPNEQFSYLAYPKGGFVLHMLRSLLGEALYRRCIQTYLERNQYGSVVTEDLNSVIEELSGRSYDRFFDQWVYHAHHPELEISYGWNELTKMAKVSINQVQKLSDDVLLFQFPLTVRFQTKAGAVDRQITVKEKSEDFYFVLPDAPKLVRIDPEFTLLAKIRFSLSDAMLQEQLNDKSDVIGRVLAVEELGNKKDRASLAKLKTTLQQDPFYGVRLEAARALRGLHTEEAFEALKESRNQPDARVRQEVVSALNRFFLPEVYELATRRVQEEKNPDIVSATIRALGVYPRPEVRDTLVRWLESESYRNGLADAAIAAMRAQSDPWYLGPLQNALAKRENAFTSSGFGRGLETLGNLARNEEKKDEVREFLLRFVNSPNRRVQLAAINALGSLGDSKALAVLETFTSASKGNPTREAAERAIGEIRAAKKPNDEWRDLRSEVLELKKQNRDLKGQLDDVKKQLEEQRVGKGDPGHSYIGKGR
ncbi:MAG: M1 family metallopeptidase [Verrucomicrobiota bacterium]